LTRLSSDRKRGIGSELSLGHILGDHFDEQVCIIKAAIGTPSLAEDLRSPGTGKTGRAYTQLQQQIRDSLAKLQGKFPDYTDESDYEIAGLVLNLGEQDTDVAAYAKYLPMLIQDLRKELKDPDLPVVLVGIGRGGREKPAFPKILEAQQAVAALQRFQGTVAYVETRDFWPASNARNAFRYPSFERWYDNAESFYEMGRAIGVSMRKLLR
jgi:Carbohydrate esterase, sialic acid-specific acetylesterase